MDLTSVFPKTVTFLGISFKDTVIQAVLVAIPLLLFAIWASRRFDTWAPSRWQLAIEWLVEYVENLVRDIGGRALPEAIPYLTTMITFIALANLLGWIPGFQAPTRDLNMTLALSLTSLLSTYFYSIRKRGFVGWLKSYVQPVFIMAPINLMGELSRLLSMALRLFGNVLSGEVITAVVFGLLPLIGPIPLGLLGSLTGVLQALVFTILTLVFILDAMGTEESQTAATAEASEAAV